MQTIRNTNWTRIKRNKTQKVTKQYLFLSVQCVSVPNKIIRQLIYDDADLNR
jgi:hypothetical protein